MKVHICVEGGGSRANRDLIGCREGFKRFFENAGLGHDLTIEDCGPRSRAYDRFKRHLAQGPAGVYFMLLIDSEGAVTTTSGWAHVGAREDRWARPDGAEDDQIHFMVQ